MEYVNFGRAGVKVSRIALGLGLRGQRDEAAAERLVRRALDGGVNLFDCANVYGLGDDRAFAGRSEEILGRALGDRRDDVVITSKVHSPVGSGPNDRGASRYHVMREVERSLRRLGTDRIDVYLLHGFDPDTPLEEQVRALDDLVHQGKVRYVGVCNYQAWQVCRALWVQDRINAAPLIVVQNPYSLLNRALESEMFPLVRTLGLGLMAYSPLGVGLLSGAYAGSQPPPTAPHPVVRERLQQVGQGPAAGLVATLRQVAEQSGATMAQVALCWVLGHPEVTVAISGADTEEQLAENLGALDARLPAEAAARLDAASSGLALRV
ncbi:MAG TPA: aldo/keto reductase [Chloroflexota bacterium]|jgi:aryl-alcohol dehydrogenase-like predicted oxidoreductase